jgi:hypothetical protein
MNMPSRLHETMSCVEHLESILMFFVTILPQGKSVNIIFVGNFWEVGYPAEKGEFEMAADPAQRGISYSATVRRGTQQGLSLAMSTLTC